VNEVLDRYPVLWALGAYCIMDSGGVAPKPAAEFAIPPKYRRSVEEAGRLAAALATIIKDPKARDTFLIGEETAMRAVSRRYGLGVLSRVLGHLFDGALHGAYDHTVGRSPMSMILNEANLW